MPRTKFGGARLSISAIFEEYYRPVVANVATDGVSYDAVATFGTIAAEVYTKLIDPSVSVALQELNVSFTQKFTGLNGSIAGSLGYWWRIRSEAAIPSGGALVPFTGAYVALSGTFAKLVGTLVTSEDTLSSRVPLGSIPYAPVRISLMAGCDRAAGMKAEIKNSTYVGIKGVVIPGT